MTSNSVIDLDKSKVKVSITLGASIIGLVVTGALAYANLPSEKDFEKVRTELNEVVNRTAQVEKNDVAQFKDIESLRDSMQRVDDNVRYIRSNISFLTEKAIVEAKESPRIKRRVNEAVERAKENSGYDEIKVLNSIQKDIKEK